jgi:hypothetical protein
VLDVSMVPTAITAHAPGYIDKEARRGTGVRDLPRRWFDGVLMHGASI